jgi:hypothetical protein
LLLVGSAGGLMLLTTRVPQLAFQADAGQLRAAAFGPDAGTIPDPGMMRLLEQVVLTKTGQGIRQGGNLSPLLLNTRFPPSRSHPMICSFCVGPRSRRNRPIRT